MRGQVRVGVPLDPDAVFGVLVDVGGLQRWNDAIARVVAVPERLGPGAEWVVEMQVLGRRWNSRSTVLTLDPAGRRFSYRSRSDDGNPSFGVWSWHVEPDGGGAVVTVRWDLHPRSFLRRVVLGPVRARQLRREVPRSIAALAGTLVGS